MARAAESSLLRTYAGHGSTSQPWKRLSLLYLVSVGRLVLRHCSVKHSRGGGSDAGHLGVSEPLRLNGSLFFDIYHPLLHFKHVLAYIKRLARLCSIDAYCLYQKTRLYTYTDICFKIMRI